MFRVSQRAEQLALAGPEKGHTVKRPAIPCELDDGMSTNEREQHARQYASECPLAADPIDIAAELCAYGVKLDKAALILRQEWGNRHTPPKEPGEITAACNAAYHRAYSASGVRLLAAKHLQGYETIPALDVAKALSSTHMLRDAL